MHVAQEQKALGVLARHLGNDVIGLIEGVDDICVALETLDKNYAIQNVSSALTLQSQLDNMKLDFKCDPVKFFVEVDKLINSLAQCGVATNDQEWSLRYLKTVPMSMNTIRHSLQGLLNIPTFTSVMVKNSIIQELAEMKKNLPKSRKTQGKLLRWKSGRSTMVTSK